MSYDRRGHGVGKSSVSDVGPVAKVGASTLVQALGGQLVSPKVGGSSRSDQLQLRGDAAAGDAAGGADAIHQAAEMGVAGPGGALPHLGLIQQSFGRHDVGGVEAHVGGDAAAATGAMGAEAYATGNHVAFGGAPSLHTAAHEAAHVVQQRGGVQLKGGVGAAGDAHEQHADAVADAVVQGKSAEGLLDQYQGGGGGAAVQRQEAQPGPETASPHQGTIQKLDGLAALTYDVTKPAFDIDALAAWIETFLQVLDAARPPPPARRPPT